MTPSVTSRVYEKWPAEDGVGGTDLLCNSLVKR